MSIRSTLIASLGATALAVPLVTEPHYAPILRSSVGLAPLLDSARAINSSYIVVLKEDAHPSLIQNHLNLLQSANYGLESEDGLLNELTAGIRHVFDRGFRGYAGVFSESMVDQLRAMPEVDYIERDQAVHTMETQRSAPWGLARISHRERLSFSTFTKYLFDSNGGDGVDVYVVDTGINIEHVEFEGRASWGKTVPQNDVDEDNNGHGSHCAGTIASRKYGVAKKANVIAVKVLGSNGSGSMSDVIAGVDFASEKAQLKAQQSEEEFQKTGKTNHKGSVANMSLGGGRSRTLDVAVNAAVDKGLHFAVAAGNDNKDACDYSPAAAEKAVTVGASTLGDERAYFSNFGKCVDVFGPGLNILSTYKGNPQAIATLSGTSMASPHVAGLLAYLLSIYPSKEFNPTFVNDEFTGFVKEDQTPFSLIDAYSMAHSVLPRWMTNMLPSPRFFEAATAPTPKKPATLSPKQLKEALLALSSKDRLSDVGAGSPNKLIFNNATSS